MALFVVFILSCAPAGSGAAPDTGVEPAPSGFEPEVDTVGSYITRTTAVLDSLEREAVRLSELITPELRESEHEGPEYFVMFYYWLFEARDRVEQMQGLLVGHRFEQLVPEVEDKLAKARAELAIARARVMRDRQ